MGNRDSRFVELNVLAQLRSLQSRPDVAKGILVEGGDGRVGDLSFLLAAMKLGRYVV